MRNQGAATLTAHDLCSMDSLTFRLKGGRVAWEAADYVDECHSRSGQNWVRISRFIEGLRIVTRYVRPDTKVEVIE